MSTTYPQDPVAFANHCRQLEQDELLDLLFTLQNDSLRIQSQLEVATHRNTQSQEWFLKTRTALRYTNLRIDIVQQVLKRKRLWEATFVQCARAVLSSDEYASLKEQADMMAGAAGHGAN